MFNFFNSKTTIATITPAELQQRLTQGERLILLDVREPSEYAEAHLKGSRLIPLDQLSLRLSELPQDQLVVAVCRSGNRSGVAADLLQRAGYTQVLNLKGGCSIGRGRDCRSSAAAKVRNTAPVPPI